MKIKCEYCGSMFDDTLENCPACNAPNNNVRRSTPDQPITIEQLKEWYVSKGLPPEETTRFFIGKNIAEPRAFGIYKDETSGNFIVYKNKDTGVRAVRYEGTDEAYAVNELFMRLKQEILEQKAHNLGKDTSSVPTGNFKEISSKTIKRISTRATFFVMIVTVLFPLAVAAFVLFSKPKAGYYVYNNALYYNYLEDGFSSPYWAVLEDNEWRHTVWISKELSSRNKSKSYYLGSDYNASYGGTNFEDSLLYDDLKNKFTVYQGYYKYDNDYYYHMRPDQDAGWYIFSNDDWVSTDVIPVSLVHQSTAQDFWYTPVWSSETQITDFEDTEFYTDYQEELREELEAAKNSSDYSWDSGDSWDSSSTDWGSDW